MFAFFSGFFKKKKKNKHIIYLYLCLHQMISSKQKQMCILTQEVPGFKVAIKKKLKGVGHLQEDIRPQTNWAIRVTVIEMAVNCPLSSSCIFRMIVGTKVSIWSHGLLKVQKSASACQTAEAQPRRVSESELNWLASADKSPSGAEMTAQIHLYSPSLRGTAVKHPGGDASDRWEPGVPGRLEINTG